MKQIVSPETLLTFPIDPVGDFTFEEGFIERTGIFHQLFTMEDDHLQVAGFVRINWELDNVPFN